MNRNIIPSRQAIFSFERKYQKKRFMIIENVIRFWNTLIFITTGLPISAGPNSVIPKIKVVFTKLAPIMLPNAKPE